jgi:hypothetical protein
MRLWVYWVYAWPLVRRHVVGSEAGAEGDEDAVPGRIRAVVAAVEDGVHRGALVVERVAAERVHEQAVRLPGGENHVVRLLRGRGECLPLEPVGPVRIVRRREREIVAIERAAVQVVVNRRDPVDHLARVRANVHEVANPRAVGDLDLPREMALPGHALREPFAVHVERRQADSQGLRAAARFGDRGARDRRGALGAPRRNRAHRDVGDGRAGHRLELMPGVEVGLDRAGEHRDGSVELFPGQMRLAQTVRRRRPEAERCRIADADERAEIAEERRRLPLLLQWRWRGAAGQAAPRSGLQPHESRGARGFVRRHHGCASGCGLEPLLRRSA